MKNTTNIQLEFLETEIINQELYVADKCTNCALSCNVYSISKNCIIYCNKFKKVQE